MNKETKPKFGKEIGEILADFENDHNEEKAVKSIHDFVKSETEQAYNKGFQAGNAKESWLRKRIEADARAKTIRELDKKYNALAEEKAEEARSAVLREVREMIETKLRNDPNNPVLLAGLEYALVVLKNIESQNDQKE